jgi:hypothetical protein
MTFPGRYFFIQDMVQGTVKSATKPKFDRNYFGRDHRATKLFDGASESQGDAASADYRKELYPLDVTVKSWDGKFQFMLDASYAYAGKDVLETEFRLGQLALPSVRPMGKPDVAAVNAFLGAIRDMERQVEHGAKSIEDVEKIIDKASGAVAAISQQFKPMAERPVCGWSGCAVSSDVSKLKLCARCKKTRYCSPECQRSHWPVHKLSCGVA